MLPLPLLLPLLSLLGGDPPATERETVRVFVFAGQSNMEGADSKVRDIERFPPFRGVGEPRKDVRFRYCIGRESKARSEDWVPLQPVRGMVGPELSFARKVTEHVDAPVAIVKIAAGGTHLGGDWNPDEPTGFEMYPLALETVRSALADLERRRIPYRLEGFMWHQGENDMFEESYLANYGDNLARFVARWRRDLEQPDLRFYVGELCTKTIWGMDLRPRMYAIRTGQRAVTDADPRVEYVPTAHVGVEIGGGVGLHYHYGMLGQLEHGENYADAYLRTIDALPEEARELRRWPYPDGSEVTLFVLAGHRNMEGERAFVQELKGPLRRDRRDVALRYDLGDGAKVSDGWEPLGPAGYYDTFGPEVSFGARLADRMRGHVAIAKFTHSGSQIIDWTPEGSEATARTLYPRFVEFVRSSIADLEARGHAVTLGGVVYHVGENDMSFGPYRRSAAERVAALVAGSRKDLERPDLEWFVSQQEPTDHEDVNGIDVVADLEALADADEHTTHVKAFGLPGREQELVLTTEGIVALGRLLADRVLEARGR
ncbi:MAG: sialate O-acetylesterase [Planctomycetota bacterium]